MIVYVDVLIFLNLIINYFLLLAVSKILRKAPKTVRIISAAFLGALSSLYIFLPQSHFLVEALFKAAVCSLMTLCAFGFSGFRQFLKAAALLFSVTVGLGGAFYAFWLLFSPEKMVINNSVVYFDISLVALVVFTAVGYLAFSIMFKIFSKAAPFAQSCSINLFAEGQSITLNALIDTGNSIEDSFSMGEIIIADNNTAKKLFNVSDFQSSEKTKSRYRILPCVTVSGTDILEGIRCDKAEIKYNQKTITLNRPILAISKTKLPDGSNAIINPKILM